MRRRIVGLTVVAAILAIALFGLPLAAIVVKYFLDDELSELDRVAEVAALSLSVDLARDAPLALPTAEPEAATAFYRVGGDRALGVGPARGDRRVETALGGGIGSGDLDGELVVAVPVVDGGLVVGAVRAAIPRSETYPRIAAVWGLMGALAAAAVGVAWLVSWRLAARLATPLEQLARSAGRLGEGDFTVRATRTGVEEIDAVGATLDSTAIRLDAILARERAFSADVSHQLRTPITGLRLELEVALESSGNDLRPAVGSAIAATDRLERTIDDLLTLAQVPAGHSEPLRLADLLEELRADWTGRLAAAGRPLRISLPDGLPVAVGSHAAFRQILTVLLDNSWRHGAGVVTVAIRDAGGALAVDVADEGPGLDPDAESLLARRVPRADGHGMGLGLARSLAEAEGGRLSVTRSAPPTFTVLLKIRSERPADQRS